MAPALTPLSEDLLVVDSASAYPLRSGYHDSAYTNGVNGVNGANATNSLNGTNGTSVPNHSHLPHHPIRKGSYTKPRYDGYRERSPYLNAAAPDEEHDLICVGFGPASLAVAVALHDAMASGKQLCPAGSAPRVLFLEKQSGFAWHAGMRLPGAKMQISFVKDLATLRDPRSEFTFLNYLHRQGRLVDFTNLGTFRPTRAEYEDYMRWAASFFEAVVRYGNEVVCVSPDARPSGGPVQTFTVTSRSVKTGQTTSFRGRNMLFATGGQPLLPKSFPQRHARVIHSSQYAQVVPHVLPDSTAPYRVAIIGAGQSAAEIFSNVQKIYPNSQTRLIMRQEFLRPSDESPL